MNSIRKNIIDFNYRMNLIYFPIFIQTPRKESFKRISVVNINRSLCNDMKEEFHRAPYNPAFGSFAKFISKTIESLLENEDELSNQQWKDIFDNNNVLNKTRAINFFVMQYCVNKKKFNLSHSYYRYILDNNELITLSALCQYFIICAAQPHKEKFNDIYKSILAKDYLTPEQWVTVIEALSLTNQWKKCIQHLDDLKEISIKNHFSNSQAHNHIMKAILREEGLHNAWLFLEKMKENNLDMNENSVIAIIDHINENSSGDEKHGQSNMLFHFLPKKCLSASLSSILGDRINWQWSPKLVTIKTRNSCPHCGKYLEKSHFEGKDVNKLKESMESNIIKGEDIYRVTTPHEWRKFREFLDVNRPFDIVVDGLNVLATHDNIHKNRKILNYLISLADGSSFHQTSSSLSISDLLNSEYKGKKSGIMESEACRNILIMGREHLRNYLQKICNSKNLPYQLTYYFTKDITKDDGFILYAALQSGFGCKLVTRDLLRQHRFLLDPSLKNSFSNWQKLHQVVIEAKDRPHMRLPYVYNLIPQQCETGWHIPIVMEIDKRAETKDDTWVSYSNSRKWICFKKANA